MENVENKVEEAIPVTLNNINSSSTATTTTICPLPSSTSETSNVTLEKLTDYVAYTQPPSPTNSGDDANGSGTFSEGKQTHSSLPIQAMSTRLPTMWLGGQNGVLYIHSGIAQWSHCITTIHLADSILHIVHYRGRVFVALANGQCCIFYRCEQTGTKKNICILN